MTKLSESLNIGKVLELKLENVGISSLEELKKVGSEEAFSRVKQIDKNAGRSILFSIDGAVQGVKWHEIPEDRKDKLRAFFNELEQKN
ncbi:MAG: TfoX/Sxy family DNA transformation protein [Candidatus Delongbacteria bacterium]|jgi:DNA transformation protein|nr:TfoX/Sxy family DNA transformation protein [Candidatus Delongbacteria bacterium]